MNTWKFEKKSFQFSLSEFSTIKVELRVFEWSLNDHHLLCTDKRMQLSNDETRAAGNFVEKKHKNSLKMNQQNWALFRYNFQLEWCMFNKYVMKTWHKGKCRTLRRLGRKFFPDGENSANLGSMLWSQFSAIFANFRREKWRFSQKPMLWSKFCKI
jgi:hypothetical protein